MGASLCEGSNDGLRDVRSGYYPYDLVTTEGAGRLLVASYLTVYRTHYCRRFKSSTF